MIRGWLQGVKLDLVKPPDSPLMAQPPADHTQGNAALMHYTWGTLVEEMDGTKVWIFDKREYTAPEIERKVNLALPSLNLSISMGDNWISYNLILWLLHLSPSCLTLSLSQRAVLCCISKAAQ